MLIFAIAGIGIGLAQNYQDVVSLKNGSVIKGVIIEQVPNQSIKIQTADGSIFVYQMAEVEKISKELPTTRQLYSNGLAPRMTANFQDAFLQTPCYKGFFDFGYTFGVGYSDGTGRLAISTTHGAQINPYIFLGVGMGVNYYTYLQTYGIPFYVDARANLLKGKMTPFIDFRVGYSVGDFRGLYLTPSFGGNFGFGRKNGVSLALGYELQRLYMLNTSGISLKLGVNF